MVKHRNKLLYEGVESPNDGNNQNLTEVTLYNLSELQRYLRFEQRGVDQIPPQVTSNMNYS